MKRSGPTRALLGFAVAGFVALSGSAALAQEDIYENLGGLESSGDGGGWVVDGAGTPLETGVVSAGPRLNPNGIGQYLMGEYYDVRDFNGDAQHNNIQIINTNTNNSNLPPCNSSGGPDDNFLKGTDGAGCYNANGGILAKIRFRESKTSREVLDFVIALSCGEVWAAKISLNGATSLPQIESRFPVATSITGGSVVTQPAFDPANGGAAQTFAPTGVPAGLTAADIQRGHFEVIATEALPCEPIDGDLSLDGDVWSRLPVQAATPTNAIGGEVFLVRTATGVSHAYNLSALSAFVAIGTGGITPTNPFADSVPSFVNCVAFDINLVPYADQTECTRQSNLALSKSRLIAQYDVDPGTAGSTDIVVTFPNKYENCNALNGVWVSKRYPTTPFQCNPTGEELTCTIYDRLENFQEEEGGFISPEPPEDRCELPREVNIIHLSLAGGVGQRGDIGFATGSLPNGNAGWVDLDLVRNPAGAIIHREIYATPFVHDILGVFLQGHQGLPTLGLVLQDYFNGAAGGTYGAAVPPLWEQVILKDGQS